MIIVVVVEAIQCYVVVVVRGSGLAREPVAGASLAERAAVAALKAAEAREEGGLAAAIAVRF